MYIFKVVISTEIKIKSKANVHLCNLNRLILICWFAGKSHGRPVAADGACNVRSGLRVSPTEAVVELGIERGVLMCVLRRWWGAYGWGHHAWVEGMLGSLIKSRVLSFLAHGSQVIITRFLFFSLHPQRRLRDAHGCLSFSPLTITQCRKWEHNSYMACFVTSLFW